MMKYLCTLVLVLTIACSSGLTKANELKVAVFVGPPYIDLVNGELVGENIDIINFLAKSIDLSPVFFRCPPIRCLTMLERGQVDMMLGVIKLPSREKDFIFINPAYAIQHQPLRFFTLKEKKLTINHLRDLDNLLVGTLRGSAYFPLFDDNKKIEKVKLTSRKQLVKMLLKGRIDTFLDREESVLPLLTTEEYQDQLVMADYQYDKPTKGYIVLSKKSKARVHAKKLSQVLTKAIEEGTLDNITKASRDKQKQYNSKPSLGN